MNGYIVVYGDGKWYSEWVWDTEEEAEQELKSALDSMGNDNWCDLHIERICVDKITVGEKI